MEQPFFKFNALPKLLLTPTEIPYLEVERVYNLIDSSYNKKLIVFHKKSVSKYFKSLVFKYAYSYIKALKREIVNLVSRK
ncbi:hypothetical protein A9Q98_04070 [Thalassotalea sp. 42_200_T64]|nr:hypothetical protein A9Q98_04070 [Thalassotalea sp. 42_200_T64]